MDVSLFDNKRNQILFSVVASMCVLGAVCVIDPVVADAEQGNVITLVVGALVGIVVVVALMPTIANHTMSLELDIQDNETGIPTNYVGDTGDLDTSEEDLIGLWPLLIIVGVMMGVIALAL